MRSNTKWLLLVGLASSSLSLVHCVGDEPAGSGGDDAGGADSGTPDNFVPPGDSGSPVDSGVDAGPCMPAGIACSAGTDPCITGLAGSGATFCARDSKCNLYCWGTNADGQLATDPATTSFSATPLKVDLGGLLTVSVDVGSVASLDLRGQTVVCARVTAVLGNSVSVMCWGANAFGQLGVADAGPEIDDGGLPMRWQPAAVPGLTNVALMNASARHECSMSGTQLSCWGDNKFGELGRVTASQFDPTPSPIGLANVATGSDGVVAVGYAHTCVINASGHVECVGANGNDQLGNTGPGDNQADASFAVVPSLSNVVGVVANGNDTCALTGSSTAGPWVVSCWGQNDHQQMGNNTGPTDQPTPASPTGLSVAGAGGVQAGATGYCANLGTTSLADAATAPNVVCWGQNEVGENGPPVSSDHATPTPLTGLPNEKVLHLALGSKSGCALMADGTVWCWGQNTNGVLGRRDGTDGNDGTIKGPGPLAF